MVDGGEEVRGPVVVGADLDADRSLRHGWQHVVDRHGLRDAARKAKACEPGAGEQRGVDCALLQFTQARVDVAAQRHDLQVGPQSFHLRLPPQRRGANDGSGGQLGEARGLGADEGVAHVRAWQIAGDRQTRWQDRRHILHRMHGKVDLARQQRLFDFLGEEALAAGVGERAVLNAIPRCLDDAHFKLVLARAVRRLEPGEYLLRLRQRQNRSTRADAYLHGAPAGPCRRRRNRTVVREASDVAPSGAAGAHPSSSGREPCRSLAVRSRLELTSVIALFAIELVQIDPSPNLPPARPRC
jgi:uroporphyrinogen decarboxylase